MTIKELYNTVKDYGITYEDIFTFERYVSFNLSSIIAVINIIRQELYPNSSNIGAPDKPCGVGRADANPKLLLNDT